MKKLLFILTMVLVASCQQTAKEQPKTGDPIKDSKAYIEYVEAYNDYLSCKQERPALTTAYMNKELSADEFQKKLVANTTTCQLKKQVFNTRWRILEAEFDKEQLTLEYKLEE